MSFHGAVSPTQRQTPRVTDGKVQKKHNHSFTPDYYYEAVQPDMVVVDRQRPGTGYRHVLTRDDVYRFLSLLPNWAEIGVGLNAVVLAPGEDGVNGWHRPGVVAVCAWPVDLWEEYEVTTPFWQAHKAIFERCGVPCNLISDDTVRCEWTEVSVRMYQLLHILLHELGHHHDRMTTRRKRRTGRGEPYAEQYALEHEAALWEAYARAFPEG